jgi:hypothetical protein
MGKGRPENPAADNHTIKIDHSIFGVMRRRAEALSLTSTQYIASLIRADAVKNKKLPLVLYPTDYSGPAMELRVAETTPPHLRSGK